MEKLSIPETSQLPDTASQVYTNETASNRDTPPSSNVEQPSSQTQVQAPPNHSSMPTAIDQLWTKITYFSSSVLHSVDNKLHDVIDSMHTFRTRFSRSEVSDEEITKEENQCKSSWILGVQYTEGQVKDMSLDLSARPWFTYRHSFPPISGTKYTTDTGWGCMVRSAQTLLAQALLLQSLGRICRMEDLEKDPNKARIYCRIMASFLDYPYPEFPFSIHQISRESVRRDMEIGQWFGPTSISQVLKSLLPTTQFPLRIHIAQDAVVYKDQLSALLSNSTDPESTTPHDVLLLIPLLLGIEKLNEVYMNALKACLRFDGCVGIAGGRPSSALYFLGHQGSHLISFDPHHPQPVIQLPPSFPLSSPNKIADLINQYTPADFKSCSVIEMGMGLKRVRLEDIDPSLVVGFLIRHPGRDVSSSLSTASPSTSTDNDQDDSSSDSSRAASSHAYGTTLSGFLEWWRVHASTTSATGDGVGEMRFTSLFDVVETTPAFDNVEFDEEDVGEEENVEEKEQVSPLDETVCKGEG